MQEDARHGWDIVPLAMRGEIEVNFEIDVVKMADDGGRYGVEGHELRKCSSMCEGIGDERGAVGQRKNAWAMLMLSGSQRLRR